MSNRAWPFPASRALAAISRQLERWQPCSLWIAHLLLHRVEALVSLSQSTPLQPFDHLILKSINLRGPASLEALDAALGLGRQALYQVLRGLEAKQLACSATDGWRLTPLGQQAVAAGQFPRPLQERRSFAFVHHDDPAQPPHFLHLESEAAQPWAADADWSFNPAVLAAAIDKTEDWKRRHRFPLDVLGLVRDGDETEQVMIDRPEKLTVVLARTADRVIGFTVTDEWVMATTPLFELTDGTEVFPELNDLSPEIWQQGWQEWCLSRKLTIAGPIELHAQDQVLRASSSQPLREQFGKRADVLKGEAWLLAGSERIRRAVLVEIV